jgi:hypothetical protein
MRRHRDHRRSAPVSLQKICPEHQDFGTHDGQHTQHLSSRTRESGERARRIDPDHHSGVAVAPERHQYFALVARPCPRTLRRSAWQRLRQYRAAKPADSGIPTPRHSMITTNYSCRIIPVMQDHLEQVGVSDPCSVVVAHRCQASAIVSADRTRPARNSPHQTRSPRSPRD